MEEEKKEIEVESETEEAAAAAVAEFVREEVADLDDELKTRARFKALSGQRSDWEPLYLFWRHLIIKTARHLNTLIIRPSVVTTLWFRRPDGLTPLCLPRVLLEMRRAGDLLQLPESHDAHYASFRLSNLFKKALGLLTSGGSGDDDDSLADECYVLAPLVEEKARKVLDVLSENHWTGSCVVTMKMFEEICGGGKEAVAVLNHLSGKGKGTRLILSKGDVIEGVKVCLGPDAVSTASSTDYSVLELTWTVEKLEKQIGLIDQRYERTKKLALGCLRCGNKRVALRFAKEMKLISLSRERCSVLLGRVENVLGVIADAESSKKVSEAIKSSTHTIRENMIDIEEVEMCLKEVDENVDSLKRLDDALASTPANAEMDDEEIEDEFNKLQLDIESETRKTETDKDKSAGVADVSETTDALSEALLNLKLKDGAAINSGVKSGLKPVSDRIMLEEGNLEAA